MFTRRSFWVWSLFILIAILSGYAIWGIPLVPFHPDESTQLYMSKDIELIFDIPSSLVWLPEKKDDPMQHYREIDAPITRYIIGIGRSIAGRSALPVDWDWKKSWNENHQLGALPDTNLLNVSRLSVVLLFPFCLILIYQIGTRIGGPVSGIIAVILLGVNALILLHNRRAMAESALTFGVLFALWSFTKKEIQPWLAGIGLALAFNAKHSAISLLPVGLISVCWFPSNKFIRINKLLWNGIQYLGIFILITFALNPYLWRFPIQALEASWSSRHGLIEKQLADTIQLAPGQALLTPTQREAAMVYNLYLAPPAFAEANNYHSQTAESEEFYLKFPGYNLFRNQIGGTVLFILTLFGIISAIIHTIIPSVEQKRDIFIILLATLIQIIALLLFIPLPWQRYVIPLVPYVCIWVGYAVALSAKVIISAYRTKRQLT